MRSHKLVISRTNRVMITMKMSFVHTDSPKNQIIKLDFMASAILLKIYTPACKLVSLENDRLTWAIQSSQYFCKW